MKGLFQIFAALWPTKLNSETALLNWRFAIASSIIILFVLIGGFFAVALGLLPGFDGFASAAGIESLDKRFTSFENRALSKDLLDMRTRQCKAISEQNAMGMTFAATSMQGLRAEYLEMTMAAWPTPSCEELGL